MTSEPLLPAHLKDLEMRGKRPRTISERKRTVLHVNVQIGGPVAEASRDQLAVWQHSVNHLAPVSMNTAVMHISQYIRWVHASGHRPDDPTSVLIRRRRHRAVPQPISDLDIRRSLLAAGQPERAWIALMAFCGLRCCEIAAMSRNWVKDAQQPAFLWIAEGKGGDSRIVPLAASVLAELAAAGMPARGYLWPGKRKPDPPTAARISARVNKVLHGLGINGTAHKLRHRFGTALYAETHDPFLVAQLMGHVSTDTTRGYVKLDSAASAPHIEAISLLSG